jgi:hypothetical protein
MPRSGIDGASGESDLARVPVMVVGPMAREDAATRK